MADGWTVEGSLACLRHFEQLVHCIPVAHGPADREDAVQIVLPKTASGNAIRKVEINFFSYNAHPVRGERERFQFLDSFGTGRFCKKKDVQFRFIHARFLQEWIGANHLLEFFSGPGNHVGFEAEIGSDAFFNLLRKRSRSELWCLEHTIAALSVGRELLKP